LAPSKDSQSSLPSEEEPVENRALPPTPDATETFELWSEAPPLPPSQTPGAPGTPGAPLETAMKLEGGTLEGPSETSEDFSNPTDFKDASPSAQKTMHASTLGAVEKMETGVIPPPPPPPGGEEDPGWTDALPQRGQSGLPRSQNQMLWDLLIENPKKDEVYAKRSTMRKVEKELRVKMHKMMFLILIGDVEKAVREMLVESERMGRLFNRMLVKNLNLVREGKTKILLALGRKRPPEAHNNTGNEAAAKEDQNKSMRYNQWTTVTSQLLSTVEQSEREIMDLLREGKQHMDRMWETYRGLREAEDRASRTTYQSFKG